MRIAQRPILVLLLVLFSIIPTGVIVLWTISYRQQEAASTLDTRLTEISRASTVELKGDFKAFQEILLTSSQDPANTQIFLDPAHRNTWKKEIDLSLLNLTNIFPGMIDEACRIDTGGIELGRVAQGRIARDQDLSRAEALTPFFQLTKDLPQGEVHYQTPYISPDTGRWVVSVSTPIYKDAVNYGILHFEVPLAYYQRTLQSLVPVGGYLAVVGPNGEVYLQSGSTEPANGKFSDLNTLLRDPGDQVELKEILSGMSGFGRWETGNKLYRVHYETIEIAPNMKMSILAGLPVVPGIAGQLNAYLLPLLLILLLTCAAAIAVVVLLVRPMETAPVGKTGADTSSAGKKRSAHVVVVMAASLVFALVVAFTINALHENIEVSNKAELLLSRMDGLANSLDTLQTGDPDADLPLSVQKRQALSSALTKSSEELTGLEAQRATTNKVSVAVQQYEKDMEELYKLFADGRTAEAQTWAKQRVSESYATLLNVIAGTSQVYDEDIKRASTLANIGSAVALVAGAFFLSLLFLRVEQVRRAANVAAEEALSWSERRFRSMVQNSSDVISIVDRDSTIRYQGASVIKVLGYEPGNLVGSRLFELVHPEDTDALQLGIDEAVSNPAADALVTYRVRHNTGRWLHIESRINNLLDDPNVGGLVLNTRDITERKALEHQLAYRAFHDPLTDLPNRALFMERLEHATAHAARRTESLAVLFLDLDGFKHVNDSLGHKIGDQLLIEVGDRLKLCLRSADTIARLGGDEFTILLEDISDLRDPIRVAERITDELRAPFRIQGHDVFISISIGIAMGTSGTDLPDKLVREADTAMYEAKNTGKAGYRIFDATLNSRAQEYMHLESELRKAVEENEFIVHYQPIVEMETGQVLEVEALVRWQHPERGIILPGDFIPLAEETGLIIPIGYRVLEEACKQARSWQLQFSERSPLAVSVNLSARQLQHSSLVKDVLEVLERTELDPGLLKLEITESLTIEHSASTVDTIQKLRKIGVKLAIDDFGAGYSTLTYLKHYPMDTLKIDRACIAGLDENPGDTAIVHAALACAKVLNLSVTAEGIETIDQFTRLRGLGCSHAQGYYFSRPVDKEAITTMLSRQWPEPEQAARSEKQTRANALTLRSSFA